MNSGPPATFLESLVYTNLVLLRRTRDRGGVPGGDVDVASLALYQRPLPSAMAQRLGDKLVPSRREWHRKAVSVPTKKSKKWPPASLVGRVQKTRELARVLIKSRW